MLAMSRRILLLVGEVIQFQLANMTVTDEENTLSDPWKEHISVLVECHNLDGVTQDL